mgnify:CR=1 FL=1|jgi:chorismate mutase
MTSQLDLENIRSALIRQEETIIFALVERAQFAVNTRIYTPGAMQIPGFHGAFVDYLLRGTEALHATVRRYTSPDENPFFDDLPAPLLPALSFHAPIAANTVNVNARIRRDYEACIVPAICAAGDDEQYGSSAVCDVACLQALSKRIHYGKFVAETKFRTARAEFTRFIKAGDRAALYAAITDAEVEARLLLRVERKAATYGQELNLAHAAPTYKIKPRLVAELYRDWIIPLTKDVEIEYLLIRLDAPEPEAPAAG